MKINLLLIFAGTLLLAVGLYRICPVQIDKKFLWANGPIFLAFIILVVWGFIAGGADYFRIGARDSLWMTASYLPMLVGIMLVMGFSIVITKHHEVGFAGMITGKFGLFGVFGASMLSPTSSAFAKFVEIMWSTPGTRVQLLYLLTAAPLISINLFFVRQIGLGPEIAWIMYKTNLLVAIGLFPVFWVWSKFV